MDRPTRLYELVHDMLIVRQDTPFSPPFATFTAFTTFTHTVTLEAYLSAAAEVRCNDAEQFKIKGVSITVVFRPTSSTPTPTTAPTPTIAAAATVHRHRLSHPFHLRRRE